MRFTVCAILLILCAGEEQCPNEEENCMAGSALLQIQRDSAKMKTNVGPAEEMWEATVDAMGTSADEDQSLFESVEDEDDKAGKPESVLFRPNYKSEEPENIEFGIFMKSFNGFQKQERLFAADMVITLQWKDERAKSAIPKGADSAVLPTAEAKKSIWMPDIRITNNEMGGLQVVSSMVQVSKDGTVDKVERVLGRMFADMRGRRAFPFDEKHLLINIASTTLMMKDLKLVPTQDKESAGVFNSAFDGSNFNLDKDTPFTLREFEEEDGQLKKSRGQLDILLKRTTSKFLYGLVMPDIFLVVITWGAFFIPISVPPYLMPRIATTFISFLAIMTHAIKIATAWGGEGDTWLDAVQVSATILVFGAVVLNVYVLVALKWYCQELADKMDSELRYVLPGLAIAIFIICSFITEDSWIPMLALGTRSFLCLALVIYGIHAGVRLAKWEKPEEKPAA